MADNLLGLALEISADPSKAVEGIKTLEVQVNKTTEAMRRTIAESISQQGGSAEQAKQIYQQLGIAGTTAAKEIAKAFGSLGTSASSSKAQLDEAAGSAKVAAAETRAYAEATRRLASEFEQRAAPSFRLAKAETDAYREAARRAAGETNASIRSMFPALSGLRQVTRLAFGAFAVGFIISDFAKLAKGVADVSLEVGGFDQAYQQTISDVVADNKKAEESWKTLNVAQQAFVNTINDTNRARVTSIQLLLDNAEAEKVNAQQTRANVEGQLDAIRQQADDLRNTLAATTGVLGQISGSIAASILKRIKGIKELEKTVGEQTRQEKDADERIVKLEKELKDAKDAEAKANDRKTASIERSASAVGRLIEKLREENELTSQEIALSLQGQSKPRDQAILQADREIDASKRAVEQAQIEFNKKKITRAQLEQVELLSAQRIELINENLEEKLRAIDEQDADRIKKKEAASAEQARKDDERAQAEGRRVEESIARFEIRAQRVSAASLRESAARISARANVELAELRLDTQALLREARTAEERNRIIRASDAELIGIVRAAQNEIAKLDDTGNASLSRLNQRYRESAAVARESFALMGQAIEQWGGKFGRVFGAVSRIISLLTLLHRLEAVSAVEAANAKAKGQIIAEQKISVVRGARELAEGFAALARRDFASAANHFTSSAKFLAVLGIAASAIGSLGGLGGGSSSSAAERESRASRSSSAERRAASESQAAQPSIQIIFQGPVYGGQAGLDELASKLSQAVIERDVNLTAFTTVRQPATRA